MKLKTIILSLSFLVLLATALGMAAFYNSLRHTALVEDRLVSTAHLTAMRICFSQLIDNYSRIAITLAGHRAVKSALRHNDAAALKQVNAILDLFNHSMKTSVCYIMNRSGVTLASSNRGDPDSFLGKNYGNKAGENSSHHRRNGEAHPIYIADNHRNQAGY